MGALYGVGAQHASLGDGLSGPHPSGGGDSDRPSIDECYMLRRQDSEEPEMPDFQFQEMLPLGRDDTPYRLITKDHVSTFEAGGKQFVSVATEGLRLLTERAMRDIAH